MRTWLLPEYFEDILPEEAGRIEAMRRLILDEFAYYGYELVMPPMLEYVDSLLTGTGHDLDLQTFKLVDQLSGRMLGVRADITPQVARIDAHLLNRNGVTRLCYAGSVLRTRPVGLSRTREPLQLGAEIFGHHGIESDLEVQQLMLKALAIAGVTTVSLDIGHVAIFRALLHSAAVAPPLEAELFAAMQTKDVPAVAELAKGLDRKTRDALALLPELYGDLKVLAEAKRRLPALPAIRSALRDLTALSKSQTDWSSHCSFDLSELRGYHYHSGVVFAAYSGAYTLAQGGRYDEVGKAFGRARPATGFSLDLRELVAAGVVVNKSIRILAPYRPNDARLQRRIASLRRSGRTVIVELPGHQRYREELNCEQMLFEEAGRWVIRSSRHA